MESLFQFELAFLTAIMALMISFWQVTTESYTQLYKYLFFVVGFLLLILMMLWINYAQMHISVIVSQSEKVFHYLILVIIQYLVVVLGLFIIMQADKTKIR